NSGAAIAARLDAGHPHSRSRALPRAGRTAIVPQVPVKIGQILIRAAAEWTQAGVQRMRSLATAHLAPINPKVDDVVAAAAERRNYRIVSIQNERRGRWQRGDHLPPERGDKLDFTVAIELIAEEVGEEDEAWLNFRDRTGHRGFIHLEYADARAGSPERIGVLNHGGGDAGEKMGPGAIV